MDLRARAQLKPGQAKSPARSLQTSSPRGPFAPTAGPKLGGILGRVGLLAALLIKRACKPTKSLLQTRTEPKLTRAQWP